MEWLENMEASREKIVVHKSTWDCRKRRDREREVIESLNEELKEGINEMRQAVSLLKVSRGER